MKETLIFYKDWWEAIKSLPTNMQAEAFNSVCAYAFEGVQPTDPMIAAVTSLMRSAIDRDNAKWESTREKRRQAGRKGGAPKGNQNASKQAKQDIQANACFGSLAETTSKQPKQANQANQTKQANACTSKIIEAQEVTEEEKTTKTSKQAKQPVNVYVNVDNNNISSNEDNKIIKSQNSEFSRLEEEFEAFRKAYPGRKRGHDTEFEAFKRKHKNWTEIVPLLMPALQRLIAYNKASQAAGQWVANFANLSTWLFQARWEEELPTITTQVSSIIEQPKTATAQDYDEEDDAFISKNR